MAPRPFWQGYLKLSLVTCPVAMTPATTGSEKVRFHILNEKTGNRVVSRYVDATTGKPVDSDEQVKGYQVTDDKHVVVEDEELEAVALESTRTIDIDRFVPADTVEPIWLDKAHYLTPADEVGEEAFAVIRQAMTVTKTAGLARLVLYRRERGVLLVPRDRGIVLWTLRYADEVRDPDTYFAGIKGTEIKKDALALAEDVIEKRTRDWSPKLANDQVQDALLKTIADKRKKKPARSAKPAGKAPEEGAKVINIMDALKRSLEEGKRARR
jgi:DNA end-binding protein Ku